MNLIALKSQWLNFMMCSILKDTYSLYVVHTSLVGFVDKTTIVPTCRSQIMRQKESLVFFIGSAVHV